MLNKIEKWHKTRQGFLAFAFVEAGLAFLFANLAVDSGSLIQWTLAIVLAFGVISNLGKFVVILIKKDSYA